ncbi:winged helix-turn-helix domain-containing protein [Halomonas sabkhae]|uniref:winged helix-turn-helix domain-containing protein n=1 Tax=Halomonas sabkhae TaxID=626223 RepID=UPI0025B60E85|nr:winged helix-turn-helix domain-containing protein [Halomonas sabkhae]MDN3525958.1 winged helix-turn-helix domain-containing protein [Halomonas sabkhae]
MTQPAGLIPGTRELMVGRDVELEQLMALLDEQGPRVLWLHGVAGIGKSMLLGHFVQQVGQADVPCLCLDGREVEPTPDGFMAALEEVSGCRMAASGRLDALLGDGRKGPLIIVVDAMESLCLLEVWLRQSLIPRLPEGVRLLLSGRHRPATGWFDGHAEPVRCLHLEALADAAAEAWLRRLGFSAAQAGHLRQRLHGHPLAIRLAAALLPAHPDVRLPEASLQEIMDQLAELYLADIPEHFQCQLLEGASLVRRVSEPVLQAMFPGASSAAAYASLRSLDVVEAWPDGLRLHDMVREALGRSLHARDPQRHAAYRARAWQALVAQTTASGRRELWRCTADLLYLIENPVVREAFFPSDRNELAVEPARAEDATSLKAIIDRHEGPQAARALWHWWQAMPEAFRVVRDARGECQGLCCCFDPAQAPPECLAEDPVTAAWCQALEEDPLPAGQRVLFIRRWLGREEGERPGEVQAACWLALKRDYMAMRPALRRVHLVLADLAPYAAVAETLGFRRLAERVVTLDGIPYHSAALDFGPRSVDGWLARLAAEELGVPRDTLMLDRQAHELVRQDRRIRLTPLEAGVLACLLDHPGEALARERLLAMVWGSRYTEGSNKVDAVVVGLRRKLGDQAGLVETVPGVGYRFHPWSAE